MYKYAQTHRLLRTGYDEFWSAPNIEPLLINSFYLEVGVEISDHPLTINNSVFPVNVTMQMGDMTFTGW